MSDEVASAPTRRSWRSRIPAPLRHGLALFIALLIIEYLVVPRLLAASRSINLLAHVNGIWLGVAFLLETAALFAYAMLTRTLLPPHGPGIGTLFRIDLATTAIAHVLPGGSAGSAGLGYRLFTSAGVRGTDAGFAMATQGMGSAVVLNVMLWIALVISIPLAGVHSIYVIAALFGMLGILAFGALIYAFTRGEEGAARLVRRVARHIPRINEERAVATIRHIGTSVVDLGRDRDQLKRAISWAIANWLLDAACLYSFLAAFHQYVDPVELFAAYGIANVLAVIPFTPGGLGIIEGVVIPLIISFGVTKPISTLAVLGWRLVNFWLPIPVGAACYVSLRVARGEGLRARREALSTMLVEAKAVPAPEEPETAI